MIFQPRPGAEAALRLSPDVGRGLTHFANEIVVPFAQAYVGERWPGGKAPGGTPPRPFVRSGQLQEKMRPVAPRVEGNSVVVYCITDPTNPRDGHFYAGTLLRGEGRLKGKYRFLPDDWFGSA